MEPTQEDILKRTIPTLFTLLFILATPSLASAQEPPPLPSVDEVMNYLDDLYRSSSSHAVMKMQITTENFSRTLEMESWSKGEDLGLVVIRSPAKESGTATLRTDEGLWNYAPRADRLIRIPSGLLSESWMGSHFSNDDLMRESSWNDDYDTTIAWEKDGSTWVLVTTSIPKDDAAVVYSQVKGYFKQDYMPLKQEFYDGDELIRTMAFSNIEALDGRKIPTKMTLIPHDNPEESTIVEYLEMDFDVSIQDNLFTPRGLRKVAGRKR